jgi:hypothetical protein
MNLRDIAPGVCYVALDRLITKREREVMATKGSKQRGGAKGSAKKSSKAGAQESSGAGGKKSSAGAKGGSKKGSAKKGASKKGGGKAKSLIPPQVKKIAGDVLGAAAAGALKGIVGEVVPKVQKAVGVTGKDKAGK